MEKTPFDKKLIFVLSTFLHDICHAETVKRVYRFLMKDQYPNLIRHLWGY